MASPRRSKRRCTTLPSFGWGRASRGCRSSVVGRRAAARPLQASQARRASRARRAHPLGRAEYTCARSRRSGQSSVRRVRAHRLRLPRVRREPSSRAAISQARAASVKPEQPLAQQLNIKPERPPSPPVSAASAGPATSLPAVPPAAPPALPPHSRRLRLCLRLGRSRQKKEESALFPRFEQR